MFISKKKNISTIKKLPIIKSIIGDEMNKECFDCGSPNPEFISINNAIFLCRNCSYLHKKFPEEISKIISNNLYKLEETELYYLYYGGNRKMSEFIYLNPKLSKYKSDILYKMNEMKFYRENLSNIINEKLGINESIENYKYIKNNNNYNNWNNCNTFNLKRKYNRRNILYLNENNNFENIVTDEKLARFSTTNKVPKKYKKRFIPELEDKNQVNRISVHNRNPAILLDMDYSQDIRNNSNNNSNLVWLNNSNYESDSNNKGYRNPGKTSFNYKNYINNTININNSNNNNFYFNQSESDIDKKYNMRNTSNNNYLTFYNKFKFEIPKKFKIPPTVNSSFNLSTFRIYSKPRLPKCAMDIKKIKNNTKSLNFSGYENYYTMQNVNNNNYNKSRITTDNKKLINKRNDINSRNDINNIINNNIRNRYSKIKSKINQRKNLFEFNYLSDDINKINEQHKQIKLLSNLINSNDYLHNNNDNLDESDKVQNLSFIDEIETKNNSTEKKIRTKKRKEYRKKYLERKNFEKEERKKMETEEKRRREELKKIMNEKNINKKQNKKKLTKKERLKLIEEERLAMQREEIKAKKKKAFENKVIKEEDEEYEQELETPKDININTSELDKIKESNLNFNKNNNNSNTKINVDINNSNKKERNDEIIDTFKNSIRNRYKRKKNKL